MPAHHGKFVSYYRVSTDKQGKSGLGLEAQKEAVQQRLDGGRWQIVGESSRLRVARVPPILNSTVRLLLARSTRRS